VGGPPIHLGSASACSGAVRTVRGFILLYASFLAVPPLLAHIYEVYVFSFGLAKERNGRLNSVH
jgi:hypothetical protein